ncbi:MAG TPA: UDP-N-acetylmuramate dehydrogenase [Candidatus Scatomorpha gallistercoris]|nr:UDP-N-acetylmuramate dehydrogenase [Candidatus Scatomorpha gallistercoris]
MADYPAIVSRLSAALPALEIRENEPMSEHCSFKIGGPARLMLLPSSAEEAASALAILRSSGAQVLIVGSCTNLLIPDEGYPGAVVRMSKPASSMELLDAVRIRAQAGATLNALAVFAAQHELTGLEFAHGIPGSVGGGVAMNAGAYGGEMRDVLESAEYVDKDGAIRTLSGDALGLSYRHSAFSDTDKLITSAVFRLTPGDGEAVRARMNELIEKRRASQPLDMPSAGSTFKRPKTGYAAALIDEAGLKGLRVGGAMVSAKHAGFVVNAGGATYSDVIELMREVRRRVCEFSGVLLEPEVKIIGPGL